MSIKIKLILVIIIFSVSGLWLIDDWKISLGVFLLMWADNISRRMAR